MAGCGGKPPVGSGGKPLLPPVIATAVSARGRFRDRNGDRPDSDGPPLRGPRPRSSRSITRRSSSKMGQFREVSHAQGRVRWVGGWVVILC